MTITYEQMKDTLLAVADQHPTRTNEGKCVYTLDGRTPHCAAAVALTALGRDVSTLTEAHNTHHVDMLASHAHPFVADIEPDALRLLADLQATADEPVEVDDDHFANTHPQWGALPLLLGLR